MGLLQKFDFKSSNYERPTQHWVCGNISTGKVCPIGPDGRGKCRATFECEPIKEGDRWSCTRSKSTGGKCKAGPRPDGSCCLPITKCVPVQTVRGMRGRVVVWALSLTVGLIIIATHGLGAVNLLSPGGLTLKHGEVGTTCDTCHEAFGSGLSGWIHEAFAPSDPAGTSKKCLSCHEMGAAPLQAHSLPRSALDQSALEMATLEKVKVAPVALEFARSLFGSPRKIAEELACTNCHKEHKGTEFDKTTMSDDRCQSCHTVRFASLSMGHPEFINYPYSRRTRLQFDHVSHISRHFEKAGKDKAPETCTNCHEPDDNGRKMKVKGFAVTCSAYHLEQITGVGQVGQKGISFFSAPGLDIVELRAQGAAIGEWPEWSEAKITPFMKVLLARDEAIAADFDRLDSLDLLDLVGASPEDIAAVERLAWGVKGLLHDLIGSGLDDVHQPMADAMGLELDSVAVSRMLGVMPLDVVVAAQNAWFPNLYQEVSLHRQDTRVEIPGGDDVEESVVAAPEEVDTSDTSDILSDEDILGDDDEDILGDDDGDILGDDDEISFDDDDEISFDDDEIAFDDDEDDAEEDDEDVEQEFAPSEVDAEAWAKGGGWFRRDFTLFYRPVGHSDRFVRTWLELSGLTMGTSAETVGGVVFETLASKESPGRCTKCHSIDREDQDVLKVKWYGARFDQQYREATVFSHITHFSLLDEKGRNLPPRVDATAGRLQAAWGTFGSL